mmetsp:Transcript_3018/g.6631  ORF Transcript_3018/g.6631 Transcript_3018/m.6631 type:complete len:325 (-) Transcript_3018:309-1283(-)
MASFFWKFRPTELACSGNVYTSSSSRRELEGYYKVDNKRAEEEGVETLPRSESSKLRTLQWNINHIRHNRRAYSIDDIRKGIIETIRDADADVVVLNEYSSSFESRNRTFEKDLKNLGYHVTCARVDYPTAVATRLMMQQQTEIQLSYDRSALIMQVQTEIGENVWVIGTHLNFIWGTQRHEEMEILISSLKELGILEAKERIVLAGDLNQQRQNDYAPSEWEKIRLGMEFRDSCEDDGVAKILTNNGFACAWDSILPSMSTNSLPQNGNRGINTNWETSHPPSTHWSGTIVDYSYGYNVSPVSVSISPAGWSDHRMTVCDWSW